METVIVTGVSGGLGSNIATLLLKNGYKIIGLSRRKNATVKILEENYDNTFNHIRFDLNEPEKIKNLYLNKIKQLGNIYGLVNNAALAYDDIITNAKVENLTYMYNVNIISPIILSKYAIRDMLLNNINGSLVHISSVSAHTGYKGLSMYGSTKGALESFSKGTAREWGQRGIRSNVVSPGFMETPMSDALSEEQKQRIYKRTSLKRATDPDSVAETVKFLLSNKSRSITGEVIMVDNGTT